VIALVEPGEPPAEGGRVERQAFYSSLFQVLEISAGGVETAVIVVYQEDLDAPLDGVQQSLGESAAYGVVPDHVEFEIDVFPGITECVE